MDILVFPDGWLECAGRRYRCALGRAGIRPDKREGDGATPAGCFFLCRLLYRADRLDTPKTGLPISPLAPTDGWCDDPGHGDYNHQVRLPHPAHCESLWRSDHLYDLIVVVGFNDEPVVTGAGSAIFLHVAAPDFRPTQGCVALAKDRLLDLLTVCDTSCRLRIG